MQRSRRRPPGLIQRRENGGWRLRQEVKSFNLSEGEVKILNGDATSTPCEPPILCYCEVVAAWFHADEVGDGQVNIAFA